MRKLLLWQILLVLILAVPAVAQLTADDNLIIPGQRIGPAAIGMTLQQAYSIFGDPSQQQRMRDGIIYSWGGPPEGVEYRSGFGLGLFISNGRGMVRWVSTNNPRYQTPDGVGVGATGMRVRAILGAPTRDEILRPPNGVSPGAIPSLETMWYGRRELAIVVNLSTGRVQTVTVWPPD